MKALLHSSQIHVACREIRNRLAAVGVLRPSVAALAALTILLTLAPPGHASTRYDRLIMRAAAAHRLHPALIKAVIHVESNFHPRAVSPKGAEGLMQLMPGTSRLLGVEDPFAPVDNVMAGARFLKSCITRHGSLKRGLIAYNAGPDWVGREDSLPTEIADYVDAVLRYYKEYRRQPWLGRNVPVTAGVLMQLRETINRAAAEHNVPPELLRAMVHAETRDRDLAPHGNGRFGLLAMRFGEEDDVFALRNREESLYDASRLLGKELSQHVNLKDAIYRYYYGNRRRDAKIAEEYDRLYQRILYLYDLYKTG